MVGHQPPDAGEKAGGTFHTLVAPLQVLFGRCGKEAEEPNGIGAIGLDHLIRVHHIALGFAHLGAVFDHHALGQEVQEGFIDLEISQVAQHLGEEAGVEQVQDGMFDPADVLIDRQPVAHLPVIERGFPGRGAGEPGKIPGRFHEGVHGVGFTPSWTAALGAGGSHKRFMDRKR